MVTVNEWYESGGGMGLVDWGDEVSVNSDFVREGWERLFENIDRRGRNDGSRKLIPQPSPKLPTLSFGGGFRLVGVASQAASSGRDEKISSDQYQRGP